MPLSKPSAGRIILVMGPRLVLLAAALIAAPFPTVLAAGTEGADEMPQAAPDIVLVTLDTTRADHLGCYGHALAATPNLDRLAERGTRFERCDCSAPITLPSHASILTGLLPPRHGVRDNGSFRLDDRFVTLAERLAAEGYDAAAVVASVVLGRHYGLAQGFRIYDDEMIAATAGVAAEERDAAAVTDAALAALAGLERPFLLWVHYYDPHVDYRPPEDLLAAAAGDHAGYDAEIAYVDRELGRLLAALPSDAIIAIAGDHGEMLGEHGEATHGVLLHRGARRVPLLLAGPGIPAGKVVADLVQTVDLLPTLLELATPAAAQTRRARPADDGDGRSLVPLLGPGQAAGRVTYSEAFLAAYAYRWHPLRALSDGRWLFVDGARSRLFDLAGDPGERRDLAGERPRELRRWQSRLGKRLEAWGESQTGDLPEPAPVAEETRRKLLSLGYLGALGGGPVTQLEELPDPYDLVDIAARLHQLGPRVQDHDCDQALPELRRILRRNRDNLPALNMTGICLMADGSYPEALRTFEHAVEIHPRSTVALANLAGCLLRLDRRNEAEAAYRQTLALDPIHPQAVANLARLLRQRGEHALAVAVVDGAMAAGGNQARWYLERGITAAEAGRLEAALDDFEQVLRREPENSEALENAAQAAFHLGRVADSAVLYRRLLDSAPRRGDLWKTLGAIQLYELGQPAAARRSFAAALELEDDPRERADLDAILQELGQEP